MTWAELLALISTSGFGGSIIALVKQISDNRKNKAEIRANQVKQEQELKLLKQETESKLEQSQFNFIESMEKLQMRQVERLEKQVDRYDTQLKNCWTETEKLKTRIEDLKEDNELLREKNLLLETLLQDNKIPLPP